MPRRGLEVELEPDARLAVADDAPAVRERVEEREPSPRLGLGVAASVVSPSAKPRPRSPISTRTCASVTATISRMRAPSRREPYLTAFVKSSLTSSRTANRASWCGSRASSRSTNARACLIAASLAGRYSSSFLRSSPAAIRSPYPSTDDLYRRRVGRWRRATGVWPRTRFASALSTSVSGRAAPPGRDATACSSLVCECGDEDCTVPIQLTPGEYESVRAEETQFAVVPGHVRPEVEDVVARAGRLGSSSASAARPPRSRQTPIPAPRP